MILNDFILKAIKANKKYCQITNSAVDINKGFKTSGNEITIPTGVSEVKITVWIYHTSINSSASSAFLNGTRVVFAAHGGNGGADLGTGCAVKIISVSPLDVIKINGNGIVEAL